MKFLGADDIIHGVKLQQVKRNYRLRHHFGMRVISLTPVVNCLPQDQ